MADITANLGLPLLLAGQVQKHVTPGSSGLRLGYANLTATGCDLAIYRTAAIATELAAMVIGRWV